MILLVGLGNPGKQYASTRHNVGFMALDEIKEFHKLDSFTDSKKFISQISSGFIGGEKLVLAKPMTFMNNSGMAVRKIMDYYKLPLNALGVIHDDLDLKTGKVKIKIGGSHGGHNGLKSIDTHLGGNYYRIRFGIDKPEDKNAVISYVLKNFSKEQLPMVNETLENISEYIDCFINGEIDEFLNACNNKQ